jgi:predicted nuclease of restriction endonuclease-like (RecB) superfamily
MTNLQPSTPTLFDRVVTIIETARSNTFRVINENMVWAHWMIGREIVEDIQNGQDRADYGKQVLENLSAKLTKTYGTGYSVTSLRYFRTFYQVYAVEDDSIRRPLGAESSALSPKQRPLGAELPSTLSKQLSWSHYRALMRIKSPEARAFYEQETVEGAWDKRTLERHVQSQYYERMVKSQTPPLIKKTDKAITTPIHLATETLKSPYVLEFLGIPHSPNLYENQLESAIITHLQSFLLELGKGFAFVARQKRMHYEDRDFYVDLVFYNCILKCYLLIDLKVGELSHQDVGQMDSYVRMFEDLHTAEDDNPTIGLILCTEKNEAIAKYSVLSERKQVFASKYMLYLPSEEELSLEIARERKLIEEHIQDRALDTEDDHS